MTRSEGLRSFAGSRLGLLLVLLPACTAVAACAPSGGPPADADPSEERRAMLERLRERGIEDDRVLAAMERVPRHEFVPPLFRSRAYRDEALPIGRGQTISQPYAVALMTEEARIEPGAVVLEVGTGSGYQAAVLAEMDAEVFTVEIVEELARRARERLRALGYGEVQVRAGDGYRGWPEEAPFDAVIVTAAPDEVPPALVEQLAPGGRLVVPLGPAGGLQRLTVIEKDADGSTVRRESVPVRFVPMVREPPDASR